MISRGFSEPTDRVKRLKKAIVDAIPYVESERAVLVTESYKETEGLSPIMRRAKAAEKIFNNPQGRADRRSNHQEPSFYRNLPGVFL